MSLINMIGKLNYAQLPDFEAKTLPLFCSDSGFCHPRLISCRERKDVDYITDIGTNSHQGNLVLDMRYRLATHYAEKG